MSYCAHCHAHRPTLELFERGGGEERCAVCGFPVQEAPLLDQPARIAGDTVLCIDDDPLIRQLLTLTLEKNGFVPLMAPDGPTGLVLAAAQRPRLVIVDIMLPDLDGYQVCRLLKADPRTAGIPLIILTAHADPKLNAKAFQAGAALALTKPFEPAKLIATLRAALALKDRRGAS